VKRPAERSSEGRCTRFRARPRPGPAPPQQSESALAFLVRLHGVRISRLRSRLLTAVIAGLLIVGGLIPIVRAAGSVEYLCDGQTYQNMDVSGSGPIFDLNGQGDYNDPNVQKVIRNCTFRHIVIGTNWIIRVRAAKNVVIEDSTFDDIHSGMQNAGGVAIIVPGSGTVDDFMLKDSRFASISSDGVQLGTTGQTVTNVVIDNNEFDYRCPASGAFHDGSGVTCTPESDLTWLGGENGIDLKSIDGPIAVTNNQVGIQGEERTGWKACHSSDSHVPGTDECTGSQGVGIETHKGPGSGWHDLTLTGNRVFNSEATNIDVQEGVNVTVTDNELGGAPQALSVASVTGSCVVGNNVIDDGTVNVEDGCTNPPPTPTPTPSATPVPPASPTPEQGPSEAVTLLLLLVFFGVLFWVGWYKVKNRSKNRS
jgi:hypothetical protein